jgi:hypothetical protein
MRMRRLLLGVWIACAAACSGRVSEPSGLSDPVGPVTFLLRNTSTTDVYVRWVQGEPRCDVFLGGKRLDIQASCASACGKGCSCVECSPAPSAVKRIAAGGKLTFAWSGTWYETQSCAAGCTCDQSQMTLTGDYEITVAAALGYAAVGATPTEVDGVITPADLDLAKGACEAQLTVKLNPGAQTVDLPISCTP